MKELRPTIAIGPIVRNIAVLLRTNAGKFGSSTVYQEKGKNGEYEGVTWKEFYRHVQNIAANLRDHGLEKGDKVVFFSQNSQRMLETELAVMASGGIAVPIFAYFKQDTADLLINHSEARFLVVAGEHQLHNIGRHDRIDHIFALEPVDAERYPQVIPFDRLIKGHRDAERALDFDMSPDDLCLNMYTSGTMGIPKCVQLMHRNILSQQAALDAVWSVNENDRLLAYLPWHHSFGGIFELFTALYHGATYSLESSYGKDPVSIMDNWKTVRPTIFFSVPKVYQALVELTAGNKEAEDRFFNSGLKFIFTAAAALPERLSNEFEKRNIPVIEGWGLTETSPCCTLTDPALPRQTGVVGLPIPGVEIRIADGDEIQVKGPNVMRSYFNNDEANRDAFTDDGWYRTGDVGEITDNGLRLISRKDRIFKLSNGEKVVPTDLEQQIEKHCHYVQYAIVSGSGEEHPVALIFPNRKMLTNPNYEVTPEEGCFCPRSLNELGRCLRGCLHDANGDIKQKFAKIKCAMVINGELSLDDRTLTPSMKVAPKNVVEKYRSHLLNLYGADVPLDEEVYIINLDESIRNRTTR
ncbi:MAG: AMP-binding protein [Flavobacteriales bacterium]|nr:AMP-binding protein [Flavobacteriales bacterium]